MSSIPTQKAGLLIRNLKEASIAGILYGILYKTIASGFPVAIP